MIQQNLEKIKCKQTSPYSYAIQKILKGTENNRIISEHIIYNFNSNS